jgi:hypothetical protein
LFSSLAPTPYGPRRILLGAGIFLCAASKLLFGDRTGSSVDRNRMTRRQSHYRGREAESEIATLHIANASDPASRKAMRGQTKYLL